MLPALRPEQIIFAYYTKYSIGDIVIFQHNGMEKVKRIAKIDNDKVWVLGDNLAHSTDSRNFGWIKQTDIIAKVIFPKDRVNARISRTKTKSFSRRGSTSR